MLNKVEVPEVSAPQDALQMSKTYIYNLYAELGLDWAKLTPAQHESMAKAVMHTAVNVSIATSKQ